MSAEIGVLVGALLAVVAAFVVARPLIWPMASDESDESVISDLLARRDGAYQVLRDLDGDYQSAKLAEDDYRQMRVQALAQAAEIVAELDAYQSAHAVPTVAPTKPADAPAAPSQTTAKSRRRERKTTSAFCPRCGTPHEPDDVFCRKCGKALT
jgi:hypothetical protein